MTDISGNGVKILIAASKTFPVGFPVTQLADDNDPLDFADLSLSETAMGVNGDMVSYTVTNPLEFTLSVIPNGVDDAALSVLHEANRASKNKQSAKDSITITIVYPNLRTVVLRGGSIISGSAAPSISSNGRIKTKTYNFHFEDKIG